MNASQQQQQQPSKFERRTLKTRSANKRQHHQAQAYGDVNKNDDGIVTVAAGERLLNLNVNSGKAFPQAKVKRPIRQRIRKVAEFTLKQSRSLVYVAMKYMVDKFGGVLQVRSQMSEDAWEDVARELNMLPGKPKPAKQWAKCFVSKKHFISCKFRDYVKTQRAHYGDNFTIEWATFTYFDLLLLQDFRMRGFPNMPCVGKLLKMIKDTKLHLGGGKIFFPSCCDLSKYSCDLNDPDDKDCVMLSEMNLTNGNHSNDYSFEESYDPETESVMDSNEPLIMPQWVNSKKSIYLAYLAYLVAKFKVKIYGLYISKICNGFNLSTWQIIADHLESNLGIKKSALGWRKNYWAHQYIVQRRFIRRREEEQQETGPKPIDWSKVSVDELLYMQNMTFPGEKSMPGIDIVLKYYEKNEKYINSDDIKDEPIEERQSPAITSTQCTSQNESSITMPKDFNAPETTAKNQNKQIPKTNDVVMTVPRPIIDTDNVTIKKEDSFDFTMEDISHDRAEISRECSEVNNFPRDFVEDSVLEERNYPEIRSMDNNSHELYSKLLREEQSHSRSSDPFVTQHQNNHNNRLLDIKEKILRAKLKKNKILRKKNKILKEHTKVFGQLLTKLDVLIELKTSKKKRKEEKS